MTLYAIHNCNKIINGRIQAIYSSLGHEQPGGGGGDDDNVYSSLGHAGDVHSSLGHGQPGGSVGGFNTAGNDDNVYASLGHAAAVSADDEEGVYSSLGHGQLGGAIAHNHPGHEHGHGHGQVPPPRPSKALAPGVCKNKTSPVFGNVPGHAEARLFRRAHAFYGAPHVVTPRGHPTWSPATRAVSSQTKTGRLPPCVS